MRVAVALLCLRVCGVAAAFCSEDGRWSRGSSEQRVWVEGVKLLSKQHSEEYGSQATEGRFLWG